MAYVSVPKDLTKVKNKVAFNLTKRQLICIGIGAAMGIPSYFLLRNVMGNSNAATVMVLLMLPAFLCKCRSVIGFPCLYTQKLSSEYHFGRIGRICPFE